MSKALTAAVLLAAFHQWQVAQIWMRNANNNPSSREMAHAMLEKYFEMIEDCVEHKDTIWR